MASTKQTQAARKNVKKARQGAKAKRSLANLPAKTKSALGKQGAAVAQRKRTGGSSPKTRAELYEIAKRKDLPGRSKMGRDELAKALGEHRIRINVLSPGWVMTERQITQWLDAESEQELMKNQCLPDKVMPEDIASMALFLASDASRACTAQEFVVDAGWT